MHSCSHPLTTMIFAPSGSDRALKFNLMQGLAAQRLFCTAGPETNTAEMQHPLHRESSNSGKSNFKLLKHTHINSGILLSLEAEAPDYPDFSFPHCFDAPQQRKRALKANKALSITGLLQLCGICSLIKERHSLSTRVHSQWARVQGSHRVNPTVCDA